MTPWDQGPDGAGQEAIYQGIPGAEKHVIQGSNHSTIFDNTRRAQPRRDRLLHAPQPRHVGAGGRGVRRRADPGRAAHGPAGATSSRSTSPSSSTRSCTCSARSPSSTAACRSGGRSAPWSSARRSRTRCSSWSPSRASTTAFPARWPTRVDARLLGRTPAQLAVPRHRRHVLVRRPGADGRARHPGDRRGDARANRLPLVPVALCLAVFHATLAVLGFDVMRWLLRVVLPVSLAFTACSRRPLPRLRRPSLRGRPRVRLAGPAPDVARLRHVRDGDVRCVADAGHERRRLLPLHTDAARHAHRARRLRADGAAVTTFVGGYAAAATGETNPFVAVADLTSSNVAARRSCSLRDRRPGHRRQHHQRLHGAGSRS